MGDERTTTDVLVIGAGIAGIEASLLLAAAGRRVHLVEKTSLIGGKVIKCEEIFANLECATCMIAPKQQALLENELIDLWTLAEVRGLEGEAGGFTARVHGFPRYVDSVNCIGCGACYDACPVSIPNEFEENLGDRKAISVPCAGALPNLPYVDTQHCLRFTEEKECTLCQEACVFEAIDFTQESREEDLRVSEIVVATGFEHPGAAFLEKYGYGAAPNVYTAFEFERLFASNGPTEGEIVLRDGSIPQTAAIVHCVGLADKGYCAAVCSMYPLKLAHYLKTKLPNIEVFELYRDLCTPGKSYQGFFERTRQHGVQFVRTPEVTVASRDGKVAIAYLGAKSEKHSLEVDMVVLGPIMQPSAGTGEIAALLKLPQDEAGFIEVKDPLTAPASSTRPGVYVTGCARGPTDIQGSVAQAQAAVGRILAGGS